MDFYNMDDSERLRWLDDGLHMTEFGYDVLGRAIARAIDRNLVERR
jgi:lysophospholipase L1-like esterase